MNHPVDLRTPVKKLERLGGTDPAPEPLPLYLRLRALFAEAEASKPGKKINRGRIVATIAQLIDADAVALVEENDGVLIVAEYSLDARHRAIGQQLAGELRLAASEAMRGKGTHCEPASCLPGSTVMAATLPDAQAAVAAVKAGGAASVGTAFAVLELAANALARQNTRDASGLIGALTGLPGHFKGEIPADPVELASSLAAAFGARLAMVGDADGRVVAMSASVPVQSDSIAEAAIRDLIVRASGASVPIVERRDDDGASLARFFNAERVVALPVGARRRQGGPIGLLVDPGPPFGRLPAEGWLIVQALLDAAATPRGKKGRVTRRRWLRSYGGLVAALLLAAVLFVPVADRIRAKAELEPAGRQFITASFAAVLRHTLAAPGDSVALGEPVAELDGEALVLSRSAAAARADEAFRRRDAAIREKHITEAELARYEGEAAAAERDLLDWQVSQLSLKSPLDGVILTSPFEHSDGAPVREGDVIAEIAPLDRLRVRIDVPAELIARLPLAAGGRLYLDGVDADPMVLSGFERAARAETIGGETVIPLRTTIDNPGHSLRPGQKEIVLLPTGTARLGEVLFRGAWRALGRWTL